MISICIPTYNFDSSKLISDLLELSNNDTEIIVIDDASQECFKKKFRQIQNPRFSFVELEKNIGRSKIRNLFLKYAKGNYLLFLDGDSSIINDDFIRNYTHKITPDTMLICGGRIYPEKCPSKEQSLRWKYGHQLESKTAKERNSNPNSSFMTNNFLIKKELLQKIQFDERITQYGHEDTLFGIELEKKNIVIQHIENPILNSDIETNTEFLDKTQKALLSLKQIIDFYPEKNHIENRINILKYANKIEVLHLKWLVNLIYSIFKTKIEQHLLYSENPSMKIFSFYKLAYFLQLNNRI